MQSNVMYDRGDIVGVVSDNNNQDDALKKHFENINHMEIRQTRRGCIEECLSCDNRIEFKYFNIVGNDDESDNDSDNDDRRKEEAPLPQKQRKQEKEEQIFYSLEDSKFCYRLCFAPIHPFETIVKPVKVIKEDENEKKKKKKKHKKKKHKKEKSIESTPNNTKPKDNIQILHDEEIITVSRPLRCKHFCCKCCCYQQATITTTGGSNNDSRLLLGTVKENFWLCVPSFIVRDHNDDYIYLMHQPTCCYGMLVNPCAEIIGQGNNNRSSLSCASICRGCCCKQSFYIYNPDQAPLIDSNKPYDGSILRQPKSFTTELYTDTQVYHLKFPKDATSSTKGLLMGISIFINTEFYESSD